VCATVTTIAGSSNNNCVLTDAGTLHCWGTNRTGQLGLGAVGTTAFYPDENTQMVRTPLRVKTLSQNGPAISDWQKVVVGFSHVCATRRPALATADELYCWGRNVDNEVGVGTDSPVVWPRLLDNTRTWTALAATWTHTCGIAGGELFCWGVNLDGELAKPASNSELFDASMPIPVPSGEGGAWTNVATGGAHTCAITTSSNVYCWGYGGDGELGDGTTNAVESPVKVMAASDPASFLLLDADYSQVCGLSGTQAYCWGANGAGAVGAGDFMTPKTAPVAVVNNINFNLLTLGSNYSCGLAAVSGASAPYFVYCWGANARNYNLTGMTTNTNAPTLLAGRTWRTFQAAPSFVCGVDDADGLLYCWGYNGIENSVGIGTLGTVPYSQVGNFPIATVKAAAVSYTSP
jgi:alpha-tubulin suppressor-like RCC1 family protein